METAIQAQTILPIFQKIHEIRGQKVILDFDLAELYDVETKVLNQAVKRNLKRFPLDFMFQLTEKEQNEVLRSQTVTANIQNTDFDFNERSRSQIVTLNEKESDNQFVKSMKRGSNIKYSPYAFTEQGIAMLSSVLNSPRAIAVNIEIMRAFVRLRQLIASHADLARKLAALEKKYDSQFKIVFDAIRELMKPITPAQKKREIGFHTHLKTPVPKTT